MLKTLERKPFSKIITEVKEIVAMQKSISIGGGTKYFVQESSLPDHTTAEINIATKF